MKLGRWGRVFSSILVLSFLLACFVFPLFETRVEASAQNALLAPVSGTSVSVENYSFFGGTVSFDLRLSGCSGFQSATLTVTFSRDCAIPYGGRNGGYVIPSTSSYSSAYFTGLNLSFTNDRREDVLENYRRFEIGRASCRERV